MRLGVINRLSDTRQTGEVQDGSAVAMIGSYAPVHRGHFDAVSAAISALDKIRLPVASAVLTPNSEDYVKNKLGDDMGEWSYDRRVSEIVNQRNHGLDVPVFVDDVSGARAEGSEILNSHVPKTVEQHLGFQANRLFLIVGSDQLMSMESHLEDDENKVVCVLRPGHMESMQDRLRVGWVSGAVDDGRLIVTERADMENDISSTAVRKGSSSGVSQDFANSMAQAT